MKGYCVVGIGENGGMDVQCCSENLVGSKVLKEMKGSILDIHLPEKEQKSAICVYPLKEQNMVVSKVTRIESSDVESRPHTLQHQYFMSSEEFLQSVKTKMDSSGFSSSFFCGPMNEMEAYEAAGKLTFPENVQEKRGLSVMKGLYQIEKWNLFVHLIYARQKDMKLAVVLNESVDRQQLAADIYHLLPNSYAVNTSMLTAGSCPGALFHLRFVSETGGEDTRGYKMVTWNSLLRRSLLEQTYPNLKRLVLSVNKLRDEFYASKHMNPVLNGGRFMTFGDMEYAAKKFLEDKKMRTEQEEEIHELKRVVLEEKELVSELLDNYKRAEKRDQRFEKLLKDILVWRNNEVKMGHELSLWHLDEIWKQAGAVSFQSKEGDEYDADKHEVVEFSKCEELDQAGRIAKSLAQGYLLQGKVLLKEDVVIYKGGEWHG